MIVLLAVFCLCIFAACKNEKADFFTYSEENLGVVGKLVKLMHGWIGNYGWTVVVFTVFLKLIMTPLDLWQRIASRKSTLKMQRMQPLMQEIDKRYGANTQRANEEKRKIYKKQGYSTFSMCLPMILSMVIFFVMFAGLRNYSTYSSVTNFQNLSGTYFDSYYAAVKEADSEQFAYLNGEISSLLGENAKGFGDDENFLRNNYTEENVNAFITGINKLESNDKFVGVDFAKYNTIALDDVGEFYVNNHETWLWLQNVWQPDTWASIMPKYDDKTNGFSATVNMSAFGSDEGRAHYEAINNAVLKTGTRGEAGKWNGLMILPFLSIGLSFLSIFSTQMLDKRIRKGKDAPKPAETNPSAAASNKVMMFLMPLMMAYFGFIYTGAFAIYMVVNYMMSLISTFALSVPVEKIVQKSLAKSDKKDNGGKASYMR